MNITKAVVDRAKQPSTGQSFIRDDSVEGFALRVTAAGVKSFIWEGRIKGRVRRITLGRYPDLKVLDARLKAQATRTAIANGEDPAEERKAERRERTFGDLVELYIEYAKTISKKTGQANCKSWPRMEQRFKVHFSHWDNRRASDVSREDVGDLQRKIAKRHGQVASNRAMTLLRAMFNYNIREQKFAGPNPVIDLKPYDEEARERFLSPDELERVNKSLMQETDWRWLNYFPLLLMLGLRKNELLSARWSDVDLEQKTLSLPKTKSGKSHLLPLPADAIDRLSSLPSRGESEWIFPGSGKTGHAVEVKAAWQRIRDRAKVTDVTVHDLRRTLGSWLAGAGYSLPVIGRALNHKSSASTQVYARLDLEPVRLALESNAKAMQLGAGR